MSVVADLGLFASFCAFAKLQVANWDIDPAYPVLFHRFEAERLVPELRVWRLLLYTTFYDLGSAEEAWTRYPEPRTVTQPLRLPTGTERRAFRGNDLGRQHVNAVLAWANKSGGLLPWVREAAGPGGKEGWQRARAAFQALPYGGTWSSYKWADLLKHVLRLPITANDVGVGGGGEAAGPIPGMVRLTGRHWTACARDFGLQQALHDETAAAGVPLGGLDQLETCLCDFNSMCKGRYYSGHDIDAQLHSLRPSANWTSWSAARDLAFPASYLGEVGGWAGVDKLRCRVFRDSGVVLGRP